MGVPIAAHPPFRMSNLSYIQLLESIKGTKKGLKLDFKNPQIVEKCLKILAQMKLNNPVMLNADVFCEVPYKFNPETFITMCQSIYPDALLSLGTKADKKSPYTKEFVDQMLKSCQNLSAVTFSHAGPIFARFLGANKTVNHQRWLHLNYLE
jgi:hypothetical protein